MMINGRLAARVKTVSACKATTTLRKLSISSRAPAAAGDDSWPPSDPPAAPSQP